ncbi:MAG: hypothetical protein ACFFC6_13325 [Promethearchaeota archaeon]
MPEVLVRFIQEIFPDKWPQLEEIDSKYNEIEKKLGFPPKKRYRSLMGGHHYDTLIIDRMWESLAKLEELTVKSMGDPEYQKLQEEAQSIIKSQKVELYLPLP